MVESVSGIGRFRHGLIGAALALSTLLALPAFPQELDTHEGALAALRDDDPQTRLHGVIWIAEHGQFSDAELLHERLRDEVPVLRKVAEQGLWMLWTRSGNAEIDRLVEQGTEAMGRGDTAEAIALFSDVIRRSPDFAEGWNKRATAYFLAGEFRHSIADCEEVFKRNPKHFGALSGNGQNWLALGRLDSALDYLRRALDVNPNLDGVAEIIRNVEALKKQRKDQTI